MFVNRRNVAISILVFLGLLLLPLEPSGKMEGITCPKQKGVVEPKPQSINASSTLEDTLASFQDSVMSLQESIKTLQKTLVRVQEGSITAQPRVELKVQPPTPYNYPAYVVGFPKSGTSSVHKFFTCNGIVAQHFCSGGDTVPRPPCKYGTMSNCILRNVQRGRPLLQDCGEYQVYAQLDGGRSLRRPGLGIYLPQHHHLQLLHDYDPNATWILPTRNALAWAESVMRFHRLDRFFVAEYSRVSGNMTPPRSELPQDVHPFLASIYTQHNQMIRDFVRHHPSHALVAYDITDPNVGSILAHAFGLDKDNVNASHCWGQANANPKS